MFPDDLTFGSCVELQGAELAQHSTAWTHWETSEEPFDEMEDADEDDDDFIMPERLTKNGRRRALSFPLKLMKVLSMKAYTGIAEWTPSGKAFKILDTDRFESEVMATHFKSAKYASFLRKLRRWGYSRLYRGPDSGAYYHKLFSRDNVENVMNMVCLKRPPASSKSKQERSAGRRKTVSRAFSQLPVVSRESSSSTISQSQLATRLPYRPHPTHNDTFPSQLQLQRPTPPSAFNALFELEVSRRLQERISMEAANTMSPAMNTLIRNQTRHCHGGASDLNSLASLYMQHGLAAKMNHPAPPTVSPDLEQYLPMLASILSAKTA